MFVLDRCYDIDELLTKNLHIHSQFSSCARREMVFDAIIRRAEECGYDTIAITDHSGPLVGESIMRCFDENRRLRDECGTKMRVLIGSEISLFGIGVYSETPDVMEKLEYRLFAQNHYHLRCWEQPEDRSYRGYVNHTIACLEELFASGYADCIAHPIAPVKLNRVPEPGKILTEITDAELGDLMQHAEAAGVAWELHRGAVCGWPEFARRFYNLGREIGSHFIYASDSHDLASISPEDVREEYKKILL